MFQQTEAAGTVRWTLKLGMAAALAATCIGGGVAANASPPDTAPPASTSSSTPVVVAAAATLGPEDLLQQVMSAKDPEKAFEALPLKQQSELMNAYSPEARIKKIETKKVKAMTAERASFIPAVDSTASKKRPYVLIGSASSAASAFAVTCSGTGCTGRDPQSTGCSADSVTVTNGTVYARASDGHTVLKVELRWSPRCGTNWSRITTTDGRTAHLDAAVSRFGVSPNSPGYHNSANSSSLWSPMLYARNSCATADGRRYFNNDVGSWSARTRTACG